MPPSPSAQHDRRTDTAILLAIAGGLVVLHVLTNGRYGFHRDELATFDDARYLAWGYVAYPPMTPFLGRLSQVLFGDSLRGARFFPALAQATVVVLAGWMARELGGKRLAQVVAALAVLIAPVALASGALLQYVAFDYLWWVVVAYCTIRLLRTNDARWWLGIGAAIGLGMMTKYTMIFLVAGIVAGLFLTDARRYLKSRWLWMGVLLSVLIFLPNLIWQIQHHFISLDFLKHIHARDVRIGRTAGFLPDQFKICVNPLTIPWWLAGLWFFFVSDAKRYRLIGWMFVVPLVLFIVARGRGYYLAPAYPVLLAGGAVLEERWLASLSLGRMRLVRAATCALLIAGFVLSAALVLPLAPVNSAWWKIANQLDGEFREEIGWPELVAEVARIRNTLPPGEQRSVGIIGTNYGEAGAIDLYGGAYGLPKAISGINSYWLRGYPDPPPQTLIVLGLSRHYMQENFQSCELAGHTTNPYGVKNEETTDHPDIFVCRGLRRSWPDFWQDFHYYG